MQADIYTDILIDRHIYERIHKQTDSLTERKADKLTDGQTVKQTNSKTYR